MAKMVDYALQYLKLGFSVIPCIPPTKDNEGKDIKKPRVPWTEFEKRRASESEVITWFQKWPDSRIGIVTGAMSDLFVVDCDSEEAHEKVETEYLPDGLLTPKAKSPHGYHYYFRNRPELRNSTKIAGMGLDTRGEGGFIMAPPSQGLNGAGYTWMKGLTPWKVRPAEMPSSLLTLIASSLSLSSYSNKIITSIKGDNIENVVTGQQITTETTNNNILDFEKGSRDNTLFHIALCLTRGGMTQVETEQLLRLISLNICNPPFPEKEIEAKIKSALQRSERRDRNLTDDIREFIGQHSGNITTTLVQHAQQMTTREDRKKVCVILSRLEKEGLLQRTGRIAGEYRIVEKEYEVVEASKIEITKGIDLSLPFYLEQYVEILPKDLIVIAGTPNAGKTALMLDMVARNQDRWECWYFSTEMGQQACARRLALRDPHINWKFKFVQDFGSYEDVIKPDCLNFIDYIEQNEGEAFKIPGILAKVQRKLNKGVAVVALQKNTGKGWGIGGEQTRAKPTLFLSVEPQFPGQILKIEKAKAFKEYNPNGFCMKFKIVKGINLINETDWGPEIAKNHL